jgi:hypothetical protein
MESSEIDEQALFLFSKKSTIRKIAFAVVNHRAFDTTILLLITISSLNLLFETYLEDNDKTQSRIYQGFDFFLNSAFILEAILKIISAGFVLHKNSYLRDEWCFLDFVIVVFSAADMIFTDQEFYFVKILRLLRILRPLRFVSHNKNIKIIVNAVMDSSKSLFNVSVVIFLFKVMFSMIGVSLFRGKLGYCSGVPAPYNISMEKVKHFNHHFFFFKYRNALN